MKGILFQPWKIKAIAENDREWQTRRLGGLKEINKEPDKWVFLSSNKDGEFIFGEIGPFAVMVKPSEIKLIKPRYQVGEVVYIKEAWCPLIAPVYNLLDPTIPTVYKQEMDAGGATLPKEFKWHSPMRMPEWAARLFIKITDIRAERLQEITEEDALAEGVNQEYIFKHGLYIEDGQTYRRGYRQLWNSINPKYPWESNPWVFVYSFKKAEK